MADSPKQIAEDICMYAKVPQSLMRDTLICLIEERIKAERKVKQEEGTVTFHVLRKRGETPTRKGE